MVKKSFQTFNYARTVSMTFIFSKTFSSVFQSYNNCFAFTKVKMLHVVSCRFSLKALMIYHEVVAENIKKLYISEVK